MNKLKLLAKKKKKQTELKKAKKVIKEKGD